MPDPNSHAGLTPLVKHEPMPSLWWLTPWTFAVQQWNARAKLYAQCQDLEKNLNNYRIALFEEAGKANPFTYDSGAKTYIYERPVNKAKRKPAPKAKTKTAKKAKR